jgi:hypothetical protein
MLYNIAVPKFSNLGTRWKAYWEKGPPAGPCIISLFWNILSGEESSQPPWGSKHQDKFQDLKLGLMSFTIGSGTASQATPQGRRYKRAEVGLELTETIATLMPWPLGHDIPQDLPIYWALPKRTSSWKCSARVIMPEEGILGHLYKIGANMAMQYRLLDVRYSIQTWT